MTALPIWRAQPERGSRLLMRFIAMLTLRAGRPVARLLLYPICAYFLLFSARARAGSRDYLRHVLNRSPTWHERFRHYHCFARQILDRVHLLTGDVGHVDYTIEGVDVLESAAGKGRGVLLVGAHLGSFEVMRVLALARGPIRLRVLMYPANAEKLGSVLSALNAGVSSQAIALGRPETMLEVRDALARGEFVGLLADRVIAGTRVRYCRFLGASAPFAEGPFILAATLGVPVVLFSAVQAGGDRYRVRFESFADRVQLPRGGGDVALQAVCQRYATWLEAACREAPYNWFNFYDFWATAPSANQN